MSYEIEFSEDFEKQIPKFKSYPKLMKKIGNFILELKETPKTGTGKPEELKGYKDQSVWSRRIDKKHRLVYEILEDQNAVKILSAWGHYE